MNIYDSLTYALQALSDKVDNLDEESKAWNENHDVEITDNKAAYDTLVDLRNSHRPKTVTGTAKQIDDKIVSSLSVKYND